MIEKMIAALHQADRWHGLFSGDQLILPDCMIEKMIAALHLADRWQGLFSGDRLILPLTV
jgi:hypothetical protein